MTIKTWLKESQLSTLDSQILLSFVLQKPKEWLLAHDETLLNSKNFSKLEELAKRRSEHEPIAYITNQKEFYGRNFYISPDVLIPRPETEQLVEYCLNYPARRIVDIGTGSGCIAITLKLEDPKLDIVASDISDSAIKIAQKNWRKLKSKNQSIKFIKSNLLDNIPNKFDVIVANLPYLDETWQTSVETKYEPPQALFAKDSGILLIKKLLKTAPKNLNNNGIIILELDPRSVEQIKKYCKKYNIIYEKPFILVLQLKPTKEN